MPVTTPVLALGVRTQGLPATGVPGSTGTLMAWVVVRTPLDTETVKESVVLRVAFWRWAWVGV